MTEQERAAIRDYAACWQRVGPELEKIRRRELRKYKFEENRELVNELLEMAADHAKPRKMSGLLKLQDLMRKHSI